MNREEADEFRRIIAEKDAIKEALKNGTLVKGSKEHEEREEALEAWRVRFEANVIGRRGDNISGN